MNKQTHYDIIGDIHGHHHKLVRLLENLGYQKRDHSYRHPEGRKVAFLGDLIDPKGDDPKNPHDVRGVLRLVKGMIDAGEAVAVMGNHEFNAIAFSTPDPARPGQFLRPHTESNQNQIRRSTESMEGGFDGEEWKGWVEWFKELPFFLELDGLRLVHAYWRDDAVERMKGKSLRDPDFMLKANTKGSPEYNDLEWLLKGLEIPLPNGQSYLDHTGRPRFKFRAKWFENEPANKSVPELTFPFGVFEVPDGKLDAQDWEAFTGYEKDAPPVFIGHYFKPVDSQALPELSNLACLDHSVAKNGPLVAYRWSGEQNLNPENYHLEP